jgi:transcriptional regulator with XRE-family HTH domain
MNLSAKLKAWRKARGLVQSRAAAALGVPPKTYLDWEQGRHAPRGFALQALKQKLESGVPAGAALKSNRERQRPKAQSPSPPASGARKKRVTHAKKSAHKKRGR